MYENKKNITPPQRNINLDLIRCVAIFCVVSVHFFLESGFYGQLFAGRVMYVMTLVRTLCMACVPLFVLLTGYLCSNRELGKGYYKKLFPLLSTYLVVCVITLLLKSYIWGEKYSLLQALFQILNIEDGAVEYAWYLSMYTGLFLLIPFLNVMYHSLQTQEQKRRLIGTIFLLTVAPSLLNVYDWFTADVFLNPEATEQYQIVFPQWWIRIWPVMYYFVGAYIREYGIKLSKTWCAVLFFASWIIVGSYAFLRSYRRNALFGPSWDWNGFYVAFHSIVLFALLLRLNLSGIPKIFKWIISRISKLSFGIYLCSYITDEYIYSFLTWKVQDMRMRYILMPVVVLASFCAATVMSQLIAWILTAPKWIKEHVH